MNLLKLVNDHAEINEIPPLSDVYAVSGDQRTIVGEVGDSLVAVYLDRPLMTLICSPNSMGDLDGNGKVEFADFLRLSSNFGLDVTHHSTGDIDCNGTVDFADFLILSNNFGKHTQAITAVPEPSSSVLFSLASWSMLMSIRRGDNQRFASSTQLIELPLLN